MDSLLQAVGDFIARNHMWAGVLLGLITFLESLAVIGAFVPATGLLVAAGGLIAAGVLDPANVIIGCVVGAVLGDAVNVAARLEQATKLHGVPILVSEAARRAAGAPAEAWREVSREPLRGRRERMAYHTPADPGSAGSDPHREEDIASSAVEAAL